MPYSYDKLEDLVNYYVTKGYDEQRIFSVCSTDTKSFRTLHATELPNMQKDVSSILAKHRNYELIQRAVNSELYMLMDQKNKIISYDPISNKELSFGQDSLQKLMDPSSLKPLLIGCLSEYEPHIYKKTYIDSDGNTIFNTYNPPEWKRDLFFKGVPVAAAPMPKIYSDYFLSLLDNDIESYTYLINWIALSLKQKTMKMLGAIGNQRIGKGVLAQIIEAVHGKDTNGLAGKNGNTLGGRFNSILADKTFVEFSEFKVVTVEEINNWKNLINATFEVEKKGIDAEMVRNHANIIVSANSMRDIKIGNNDQRLSLLNFTKKTLQERLPELGFGHMSEQDYVTKVLLEQANINQLAAYLWNYEADQKLGNTLFKSKTLENLHKAQLNDWMKELLINYCYKNEGKTVLLSEVCKWLDDEMNTRLKLKKRSFEELALKLEPLLKGTGKSYFELGRKIMDGSKTNVLIISKKEDQPSEDFLEKIEIVEEV